MSDTPMTEVRNEFFLHEYDAIQQKMGRAVEDLARVETIIPVAIAAIYAWSLHDGIELTKSQSWLLFIPFLLAVLGALRQRARLSYLAFLEEYVRKMENVIYLEDAGRGGFGYEHAYINNKGIHGKLRLVFWVLLILGTLAFAIYMSQNPKLYC